jgi:arylsulfatase A-like enzyme
MIRTETAKYVYSPHGLDELYDLADDPFERINRIDDPAYVAQRNDLRGRLLQWMVETNDPLALWSRRIL